MDYPTDLIAEPCPSEFLRVGLRRKNGEHSVTRYNTQQEIDLRRQIERVAAQRRALPPGGEIPEDYVFEAADPGGKTKRVRLSELFAPGKDTLAIYSFMFGPERERPCPGCTHFLDSLDGAARHICQRINLAVVAKSPLLRILSFAEERGCLLQLLSTAGNPTPLARHASSQPYGSNKTSRMARNGTCRSGCFMRKPQGDDMASLAKSLARSSACSLSQ